LNQQRNTTGAATAEDAAPVSFLELADEHWPNYTVYQSYFSENPARLSGPARHEAGLSFAASGRTATVDDEDDGEGEAAPVSSSGTSDSNATSPLRNHRRTSVAKRTPAATATRNTRGPRSMGAGERQLIQNFGAGISAMAEDEGLVAIESNALTAQNNDLQGSLILSMLQDSANRALQQWAEYKRSCPEDTETIQLMKSAWDTAQERYRKSEEKFLANADRNKCLQDRVDERRRLLAQRREEESEMTQQQTSTAADIPQQAPVQPPTRPQRASAQGIRNALASASRTMAATEATGQRGPVERTQNTASLVPTVAGAFPVLQQQQQTLLPATLNTSQPVAGSTFVHPSILQAFMANYHFNSAQQRPQGNS